LAVPDRRNYPGESQDPSRVERESLKGDKYSLEPPQDPFNPYSYSSTSHPTDHVNPRTSPTSSYSTSQHRQEEEGGSSNESESNSGSETEAPSPRMTIRGRGDAKSRSKTVPIPIRLPLDGSSDPSAMSISQSSAQQGSSRPDPRVGGTNADYAPIGYRGEGSGAPSGLSRAMSQQPWVGGQLASSSERKSHSGHQEKESARSSRRESRARGMDEDFVGSYRGEEPQGGQPISPSDSQTRWSQKERESRMSAPQSSSFQDPQSRATVSDYVPGGQGGYRGEGSGGPSALAKAMSQQTRQPAASDERQSRSSHQEKGARSSSQESRARGMDEDYVRSYRDEESQSRTGGQPISPRDSQTRWSQRQSSRQGPQSWGTDKDYGSVNRIPYAERDNGSSTTTGHTLSTTPHPPGPPLIPKTSVPQRKEEESPSYNTRGSSWGREGSSQPVEPSRTKPHGSYLPTDTIRPPQYESQYSNPSQVQGSLGSQRTENTWMGDPSRPSGGDSSSNPSIGATGSNFFRGRQPGVPPGWAGNPPHRVFFLTPLH